MPRVLSISVVTVVFNDRDNIVLTLQSVADQASKSVLIQHIIIDGASTDGTGLLVDDFVNSQMVSAEMSYVVVHEPDRGIYDAMDKGRRMATGDFVYFLNAGDKLSSNDTFAKVAECMRLMGENANLYFGQVRITSKYASWCRPNVVANCVPVEIKNVRDLPHHQSAFYPRSFYAANVYNIEFIKYGDTDFSVRCVEATTPCAIPVIVAEVALGGFSTRRQRWRELWSIRNDFRRLASRHPQWISGYSLIVRDLFFLIKWLTDRLLGADFKHLLMRFHASIATRAWKATRTH